MSRSDSTNVTVGEAADATAPADATTTIAASASAAAQAETEQRRRLSDWLQLISQLLLSNDRAIGTCVKPGLHQQDHLLEEGGYYAYVHLLNQDESVIRHQVRRSTRALHRSSTTKDKAHVLSYWGLKCLVEEGDWIKTKHPDLVSSTTQHSIGVPVSAPAAAKRSVWSRLTGWFVGLFRRRGHAMAAKAYEHHVSHQLLKLTRWVGLRYRDDQVRLSTLYRTPNLAHDEVTAQENTLREQRATAYSQFKRDCMRGQMSASQRTVFESQLDALWSEAEELLDLRCRYEAQYRCARIDSGEEADRIAAAAEAKRVAIEEAARARASVRRFESWLRGRGGSSAERAVDVSEAAERPGSADKGDGKGQRDDFMGRRRRQSTPVRNRATGISHPDLPFDEVRSLQQLLSGSTSEEDSRVRISRYCTQCEEKMRDLVRSFDHYRENMADVNQDLESEQCRTALKAKLAELTSALKQVFKCAALVLHPDKAREYPNLQTCVLAHFQVLAGLRTSGLKEMDALLHGKSVDAQSSGAEDVRYADPSRRSTLYVRLMQQSGVIEG